MQCTVIETDRPDFVLSINTCNVLYLNAKLKKNLCIWIYCFCDKNNYFVFPCLYMNNHVYKHYVE